MKPLRTTDGTKHLFEVNFRKSLKILLYTFLFNTFIALFLVMVVFPGKLTTCFIMSQSIGMSICTCILVAISILKPASYKSQYAIAVCAIALGIAIGITAGASLSGLSLSVWQTSDLLFKVLFISIVFGFLITYFFLYQDRYSETRNVIQEERIKRLSSEKRIVEAKLKMLQAQIEPHFLFNTLSNILSLLDTDKEKSKNMLQDLTQYLRTSLSKSRAETTTIGQEIATLRSYLNIFKIRMNERLQYKIEISEEIKACSIPPMLLQPLVENAIKHGLEPKIDGGEIIIRGKRIGNTIRLEVIDSGLGFKEEKHQVGLGLSNITERLQTLYGDKGTFMLEENPFSGLKAIIEVPYVKDQGNYRG